MRCRDSRNPLVVNAHRFAAPDQLITMTLPRLVVLTAEHLGCVSRLTVCFHRQNARGQRHVHKPGEVNRSGRRLSFEDGPVRRAATRQIQIDPLLVSKQQVFCPLNVHFPDLSHR